MEPAHHIIVLSKLHTLHVNLTTQVQIVSAYTSGGQNTPRLTSSDVTNRVLRREQQNKFSHWSQEYFDLILLKDLDLDLMDTIILAWQ